MEEQGTLATMKANKECMTATPMPHYRCHKEVWALKIKKVHHDEWGIVLVFEGHGFMNRAFTNDQLKGRPEPQDGWYMVQYKEGYISFSPAKEFEDGYARI